MQMTILEVLFILSSLMVMPAVAWLVLMYLNGNLTRTENARFLVLSDPEPDYWARTGRTGAATGGPGAGDATIGRVSER